MSPAQAEELFNIFEKEEKDSAITYYAVTRAGELFSNVTSDSPNAVTWGVFPGRELVQPTVVDKYSFEAWKDEAFELGQQWANLYPSGSKANQVLNEIFNTYYLVNVVHNDYRDPDSLAIFRPFVGDSKSPALNGSPKLSETNGANGANGH